MPLAEARLSTFLAADKDNTDDAPDAFLSGAITDAMARYNLTNLLDAKGGIDTRELARRCERLCETVGVSADVATRIATGLRDAAPPRSDRHPARALLPHVAPADPPLMPQSAAQLAWLGVDAESLRALEPYVVLIPTRCDPARAGERQHGAARGARRGRRQARSRHRGTDRPGAPARAAEDASPS